MEWRRIEEKWLEMTVRLQAVPPKKTPQVAPAEGGNSALAPLSDPIPVFETTQNRAMA